MFFSIIIPSYNSEKYIKRCIDSIVSQNYDDIEIIVVNDGSIDRTLDIINSMKDARIKLINKQNTGVSDSRNVGLLNAKGKYVIFMDSDDTMPNNTLQKLHQSINEISYLPDIIFGYYSRFDDRKKKEMLQLYDYKTNLSDVFGLDIWPRLFCLKNFFSMPIMAQIYNKDFLIDNELLFDIKQFVSEDHDWRYRLLLKSKRYLNCGYCLYNYCENNVFSVTNSIYSYAKYENSMRYLLKWNDFSQSEICPDEIRRILQDIISRDFINHAVRIFDIYDKVERHKAMELFKKNDKLLKFAKPFKYKLSSLIYLLFGMKIYLIAINCLHHTKSYLLKESVY